MIRVPAPLLPGDTIAVTSPSAGVPGPATERIEFCMDWLRAKGFSVVVGRCMDGAGISSAPVAERAAELTELLRDPEIRCVIPPWGGETAIDLVDQLDWDVLRAAEPTWVVGFSDISTILVPLTTRLGWATIHGDNLADTPYLPPDGLLSWIDMAASPGPHVQTDSGLIAEWSGIDKDPHGVQWRHVGRGTWSVAGSESVHARGRLIGGCIETLVNLAGTPYGDISAFGKKYAEEGLLVYLEAAEDDAATICRNLHGLRLAGWFDHANAILIGRTNAPDHPKMNQREAVLDALGRLELPIVFDLEIGHVPPHLPLVNGALATITVERDLHEIIQDIRA